jgi:hypothetical protein
MASLNTPFARTLTFATFGLTLGAGSANASDVVEVLPLTDRILMVHLDDGYVIHHKRGQKRSDERVVAVPLDVAAASRAATYAISSPDDPAYRKSVRPSDVGRKTKGTDFAWFADRWVDGRAVNDRPDHAAEHWIYLHLPKPLQRGKTYQVGTGELAKNGRTWKLKFDERTARSEAVHVNLLGYVPGAPQKYAYVYHWMGDRGGLDLKGYAGRSFEVREAGTGRVAHRGKVAFRRRATDPETFQATDTPNANFLGADVYECDFSSVTKPGRYFVTVDGIGRSFPFRIDADVYREAYTTVARALYHNRSGIPLKRPYTTFERPAPHNPNLTPGFKGKLQYSTLRFLDYGSESGTKEMIEPTLKGPLESWGWYQDAGDWDSYESHLRVAQELLLAYELAPRNFADGDLNIPESGNGVPDILDEAAWLPRFCHRLRHELLAKKYGTGGIGLRVAGDAFGSDTGPKDVGIGSWEDVDRIYVASGEDPVSTFRYAGAAAHLAHCLRLANRKDPEGVDWEREAREAYAWAEKNLRPGDDLKVRQSRTYATAALFRLTGEKPFEEAFSNQAGTIVATSELWFEDLYGPAVYALGGAKAKERNPELLTRVRAAILHTAEAARATAERRALRWGGNWSFPMLIGHQTTPWLMEIAVGRALVQATDPAKARQFTGTLYTTCDYFLGTNSLNQTWVTGLGPRHPKHVFHMDAWYNGKDRLHPGMIPYSPWRKVKDQGQGPWDHDWPNKTLHPGIDRWPGNERWFENRNSPLGSEFTIHQNIAPAAAIFGILSAPRK